MPELSYCPACGHHPLAESSSTRLCCDSCGLVFYRNVATTASLVMRQGDLVLLSERGTEPRRGFLDFPGGFLRPGESLEQGLRRELAEELNYVPGACRYLLSVPNQYPYAGLLYELCDIYFLEEVSVRPALCAADDVAALHWQDIHSIRREEIAFDSVWQVIEHLRHELQHLSTGGSAKT